MAILKLSESKKPALRIVRGKVVVTAYYGFDDASSGGFGLQLSGLMESIDDLDYGDEMLMIQVQTIEN